MISLRMFRNCKPVAPDTTTTTTGGGVTTVDVVRLLGKERTRGYVTTFQKRTSATIRDRDNLAEERVRTVEPSR